MTQTAEIIGRRMIGGFIRGGVTTNTLAGGRGNLAVIHTNKRCPSARRVAKFACIRGGRMGWFHAFVVGRMTATGDTGSRGCFSMIEG